MSTALVPYIFLACATPKEQSVEFDNLPPYSPIISFSPTYPKTVDDLVVRLIDPDLEDPDGDPVSIRYDWYKDDEPQNIPGDTVFASLTTKGEVWTLRAYTNDGQLDSMPSSVSVTIKNTPPIINNYSVINSEPNTNDDLIVEDIGTSDADEEEVSITYKWLQNGDHVFALNGSSSVDSSYTSKGDEWTLELTPSDSTETGEVERITFNIGNTPPTVTNVELTPTQAYQNSTIEAVITFEDIDQDNIDFEYNWLNNGLSVSQSETLDGSFFQRGDQISLEVIASDGMNISDPFTSNTITILNSPPTLDSIDISPSPAYTTDTLLCTPTGENDLDGDTTALAYTWYVNGLQMGTSESLESEYFSKGDTVECSVQISDATTGQSQTKSIDIENTVPVPQSISITDPVTLADIIYCEAASTDADQDNLIHEYVWYVNGAAIAHSNSFLNASSSFFNLNVDDQVYCTAAPFDGDEYGAMLTSSTTTLLPASITLSGHVYFNGQAIGGVELTADTNPITSTISAQEDGSYSLSVPTLSGANVSLNINNQVTPENIALDIVNGENQVQDFLLLDATFPEQEDQYESDNGYVDPYNFAASMQSSSIEINDALQYRTLYPPGDEDWISVDLIEGVSYSFFTTLLFHSNDTTIFLYDAQGVQLAYNDDYLGKSSHIENFTPPQTGTYFLKVDTYETQDLAFYLLGAYSNIDDDADSVHNYFDCNDLDPNIEPFAAEIYSDGTDQDCDGIDLASPTTLDAVEAMGGGYAEPISEMHSHLGEHIYRSVNHAYSLHSALDIDLFSIEVPAKSKVLVQVDLHGATTSIGLDLFSSSNTLIESSSSQNDLFIENSSSIAQLYYVYTRNDIDQTPVNYNIFWYDFGTDNDLDGYYSKDWNWIRDSNDSNPFVH